MLTMPAAKRRKKRATKSGDAAVSGAAAPAPTAAPAAVSKGLGRRKTEPSTTSVATTSSNRAPKKLKKKTSVPMRGETPRIVKRKKKGRKKKKATTEGTSLSESSQEMTAEGAPPVRPLETFPADATVPPPLAATTRNSANPQRRAVAKSALQENAGPATIAAADARKESQGDLRYGRKEMEALQTKDGTAKEEEDVKKKKKKRTKKAAGKKKKKKKIGSTTSAAKPLRVGSAKA